MVISLMAWLSAPMSACVWMMGTWIRLLPSAREEGCPSEVGNGVLTDVLMVWNMVGSKAFRQGNAARNTTPTPGSPARRRQSPTPPSAGPRTSLIVHSRRSWSFLLPSARAAGKQLRERAGQFVAQTVFEDEPVRPRRGAG